MSDSKSIISCKVGGRPVNAKETRRSSVALSAWGGALDLSIASSAIGIDRSMGDSCQSSAPMSSRLGTAGLAIGSKDQCPWYDAPCSIHFRIVSFPHRSAVDEQTVEASQNLDRSTRFADRERSRLMPQAPELDFRWATGQSQHRPDPNASRLLAFANQNHGIESRHRKEWDGYRD